MEKHRISHFMIGQYENRLREEERSRATIEKYLYELQCFAAFAGADGLVTKEVVIRYKRQLTDQYAISSVNTALAAINGFFKYMGWYDCVVKTMKIQRDSFRSSHRTLTKEEYYRLLEAAKQRGNQRLYLVMQAICATGIRVSELQFFTLEAAVMGHAKVTLKGKTRSVLLPEKLRRMLIIYARSQEIKKGSIFVTRNGRPLDRSNICHEMKALAAWAQVERSKIFPHNLRHLFACSYYEVKKDLSHLADLLGHSSINTTRIYTLVSGDEQAKQIEALGLVT